MSTSTNTLPALLAEGWTLDSAERHLAGECDRLACTGQHSDDTATILATLIQDALSATAVQASRAVRAYHLGTNEAQAEADASEAHREETVRQMWRLFYDVAGNL
jgi:hypothetical protein